MECFCSVPCDYGTLYKGEIGCNHYTDGSSIHKSILCSNRDTNNGIAVHILETSHNYKWDEACVVMTEQDPIKGKVK